VGPRSSDENSAIHQSLLEHLHLGLGGRRRTDHQHFDGVTDCAGRLACINHISSTKQILSWRKISITLTNPAPPAPALRSQQPLEHRPRGANALSLDRGMRFGEHDQLARMCASGRYRDAPERISKQFSRLDLPQLLHLRNMVPAPSGRH
jgi:hypothetical protein